MWVTQLGSASGSCPRRRRCRRRHGGGGGGWRRTRLGAAFKLADCLPLPWLVGHAAWVCVGGEPLVVVAAVVVVVVGSWLAELSQAEAIHTESIEKAVHHENMGTCDGHSQWSHLHLSHPFVGGALHTGASTYTNAQGTALFPPASQGTQSFVLSPANHMALQSIFQDARVAGIHPSHEV